MSGSALTRGYISSLRPRPAHERVIEPAHYCNLYRLMVMKNYGQRSALSVMDRRYGGKTKTVRIMRIGCCDGSLIVAEEEACLVHLISCRWGHLVLAARPWCSWLARGTSSAARIHQVLLTISQCHLIHMSWFQIHRALITNTDHDSSLLFFHTPHWTRKVCIITLWICLMETS